MRSESQRSRTKDTAAAVEARVPSRLGKLWQAHPHLLTWLLLAIGMVAILLWAARDAELLLGQRLFLVLATIGLAGLCTWIIGWEK